MREEAVRDKILTFMKDASYAPMTAENMIDAIPVEGEQLHEFWETIVSLEKEGYVVKTRFETYGLPEKMGLVAGRFQLSSKGFGFVIPDNKGERPDVFIPPRKLHGAMNNDRVMARIDSSVQGRRPEGEILRIISRANRRIVGLFKQNKEFAFVTPDDKHIGGDIYVLRKDFGGAVTNQKVVLEITEWPTDRRNAEGRVVEVLGFAGDPGMEILSIIKQYDLPLEFPDNVKKAAYRVPERILQKDLQGREDRRTWSVVTVDSEDARDLDDAVYVRRLDNGRFLLGVYIADVSYYVKAKTLLDREARERGTSVYLVDRVLPMLPPRLSNGICSLNEGEDRLVMACEMEIDSKNGRTVNYRIFPSVICSRYRLSYNLVRGILEEKVPELQKQYMDIVPMLENMQTLCRLLQKKRAARGAIIFDLPEQKVILDAAGRPLEIKQRIHGLPESIIEEFMLAANETVARHLSEQQWPCVYRVHDLPSETKVEELARLLHSFGIGLHIPQNGQVQPGDVQKALDQMKGRPEERLVNTVALRSMRQAMYQTDNTGHFGLAAQYYCHFTSPIRRYPDLLVHRILHEWLWNPSKQRDFTALNGESLQAIAEHASLREREAIDAERATVDFKKAEYMLGYVGQAFEGVISGVTSFGMFVELPEGVEGLVHISSLTDDYYEFVEKSYCLVGSHTGNVYRLGDTVKIEVLQVNLEERSIDFILAGTSRAVQDYIKLQLEQKGGRHDKQGLSAKKKHSGKKTAADKKKGSGQRKDGKQNFDNRVSLASGKRDASRHPAKGKRRSGRRGYDRKQH